MRKLMKVGIVGLAVVLVGCGVESTGRNFKTGKNRMLGSPCVHGISLELQCGGDNTQLSCADLGGESVCAGRAWEPMCLDEVSPPPLDGLCFHRCEVNSDCGHGAACGAAGYCWPSP